MHCKPTAPILAHAQNQRDRLLLFLYQRIAQLEMESEQRQQLQQAVGTLDQRYQSLLEIIPEVIYALDEKGVVLTVNKAVGAFGYAPEEVTGRLFVDLIEADDRDRMARAYREVVAARKSQTHAHQFRIRAKTGEIQWIEAFGSIEFSPEGQFLWCQGMVRAINEAWQRPNALLGTQESIETIVNIRTQILMQANEELQRKIAERFTTEKALRDREAELESEKANLQEANTALKVLLKRREEDKRALEEQVLYNVKKMVLPYLNKVQKESPDERHKTYMGIVESNLRDITCGFSRRLSLAYYGLSTAELKVANFIRQGKKNREIAHLLGLSIRTVEAYRQGIRNKLRLQNKKVNLRTFLMSIH
ncbi:MAG: PAS domain S-box protein [Desulfatitalea sp.]